MSNMVKVGSESNKRLPAEMHVGSRDGLARLMANQAVMNHGVSGLGDDCPAGQIWDAEAMICTYDFSGSTPDWVQSTGGAIDYSTGGGGSSNSGGGMSAADIAALITSISAASLPALVASKPGTILTRQANGTIQVYSQPTGTTANLPGNYGQALGLSTVPGSTLGGGTSGGSLVLPNGTVAQLGLSSAGTSTLLIGGLGLLAVVLLMGRK